MVFWMEKFPLAAGFESLTKTSKRWWSKKCALNKLFSYRNSWMLNIRVTILQSGALKKTTIQLVGKNERVSQHSATKPLRGCRLDISVAFVRSMSCLNESKKNCAQMWVSWTDLGLSTILSTRGQHSDCCLENPLNLKKQDWNPHFWNQFE